MRTTLQIFLCAMLLAVSAVGCRLLNRPSGEQLTAALKDKDWQVRAKAAEILGKRREATAIAPLIVALRDRDADVAAAAGQALARIGTPAIPGLLEAMQDDPLSLQPEPGLTGASKALVLIGKDAVEPLIPMLKSEDFRIRVNAAKVLGESHDPRAITPLRAAATDEVWRVRVNAHWALEKLEQP